MAGLTSGALTGHFRSNILCLHSRFNALGLDKESFLNDLIESHNEVIPVLTSGTSWVVTSGVMEGCTIGASTTLGLKPLLSISDGLKLVKSIFLPLPLWISGNNDL